MSSGKHYVVTGGAGFIGSHLVDALLAKGHGVTVIDDLSTGKRGNLAAAADLIVGDVTDHDVVACALARCDGCFHLAAVSSVERCNTDWPRSHHVNAAAAVGVFNAARATAGRPAIPVVYASSAAVFGDNPHIPLVETAATAPISSYGNDKLTTEMNARIAASLHGVPTIGLRFFNVFGARQDPSSAYSGVISIFADRIRRAEPITIFGDGEQTRDFLYVHDAVEALQLAMPSDVPAISQAALYNICTGTGTSLLALAALLGDIIGHAPVIRHQPARRGDIRHSRGNPAGFARVYGFMPQTDLKQALTKTITTID